MASPRPTGSGIPLAEAGERYRGCGLARASRQARKKTKNGKVLSRRGLSAGTGSCDHLLACDVDTDLAAGYAGVCKRTVRRRTIGISSYPPEGAPAEFSMPCGYVDAVRGAGAMAVILPPGEPDPEELLDFLDGVILSGGGDLDPQTYGGRPHGSLYEVCRERDRFELALTRALLSRRKLPALFICRGLQVLNTACGGTLHAHIPDRFGDKLAHRLPPRDPARHTVRIEAGSRLATIVGATEIEVCSWHHQAVDRLGAGLRPIAWSEDGVIEAVEHVSHPWCIGVQWHPEMQLEEEHARRLFSALVGATQGKKWKENEREAG